MEKLILVWIFSLVTCIHLSGQGEFVVEYDLEKGIIQKVCQKIEDVDYIYPGHNTYNENSSVFYFISASPKRVIYGINTLTGSQDFRMEINQSISAIEYSNVQNKMFAMQYNLAADSKRLISIDLSTKSIENVSEPMPSSSMFQGQDSYNDRDTVYTYIAPPNILYSIKTTTGKILHSPTIVKPAGHALNAFEYHPGTGQLFGFANAGNNNFYLCSIDIATGQITKIGNFHTTIYGINAITINQNENQCIVGYSFGASNYIAAFSLTTGEMIYNVLIELEQFDNVIDLEFDNKINKLFSKHWDAKITTYSIDQVEESMRFYPNPTTDKVFFNTDKEIHTIDIYDVKGHHLKSVQFPEFVDTNDMDSGIYLFISRFVDGSKDSDFIQVCK